MPTTITIPDIPPLAMTALGTGSAYLLYKYTPEEIFDSNILAFAWICGFTMSVLGAVAGVFLSLPRQTNQYG